ncbi:MAG: hypothetical protein ACRDOL_25770 [Streptosporangiaceae bacterium]
MQRERAGVCLLTLTNVTGQAGSGNAFTGNQADQGGGIYNGDDATIGTALRKGQIH